METEKKTGKRGRPRKIITEPVVPVIKRKRGRPPKDTVVEKVVIDDEDNIVVKKEKVGDITESEEDIYIPPKILRKIHVLRFDKNLFHSFVNKYNGDIVIMSYIFDQLMRMYLDGRIVLDIKKDDYYYKWVLFRPVIEPIEDNISSTHGLLRGIPTQYRYHLLVDKDDIYDRYEHICYKKDIYPPYVTNELVKAFMNEKNKINIDITKYREWCAL